MREFFIDKNIGVSFKMFDLTHIVISVVVIVTIILMYLNRDRLFNMNEKLKRKISLIGISIMFINMLVYYISLIIYGEYTYKEHLPLHFCFISGFTFMYAVLTKNEKVYKLVYFFSFMGPLPAMIWPDIISGYDSYIFYQFLISHHFFLIMNFFVFYTKEHKFSPKDIIKGLVVSNIYFFLIYIFNNIFSTNYIMQNSLPDHVLAIYPWIYYINYPILILEVTGILFAFLAYIPIHFRNKEEKINLKRLTN